MPTRSLVLDGVVFAALVAAAFVSRFAEVAPNFAAVAAAGLFAGFYFRSRAAAVGVPILAMVLSDPFLGGYPWYQVIAVYGCLALPVVFGRMMNGSASWGRVAGSSLAASIVFFVVTNFAVWAGGVYGYGPGDLARCYVAAAPFFKYTVSGDLFYAGLFFGVHALVGLGRAARVPAAALVR
ncbi:MAG: hypothetical protein JNK58_06210 [Phycisphaerae bacterium]|nr:hypothetical protein [Phycisphaerae bacterium]